MLVAGLKWFIERGVLVYGSFIHVVNGEEVCLYLDPCV